MHNFPVYGSGIDSMGMGKAKTLGVLILLLLGALALPSNFYRRADNASTRSSDMDRMEMGPPIPDGIRALGDPGNDTGVASIDTMEHDATYNSEYKTIDATLFNFNTTSCFCT